MTGSPARGSGRATADIVVVADDLTGTLDTAAPFAAGGRATVAAVDGRHVVAALRHALAADGGAASVIGLNAASRHLPAPRARQVMARIGAALAARPPRHLFKKVDSTLRGNVIAETDALMAATGHVRAVIAPAVPAQGRTVRGGDVYVDGVPLPDTEFARDRTTAAPPLSLMERAGRAAPGRSVAFRRPGQALPTRGLAIFDAESDGDLDAIAATVMAAVAAGEPAPLLVGAAGLAQALDRALAAPGIRAAPEPDPAALGLCAPILFVVGSRSATTRAQVAALREAEPDLVTLSLPGGRLPDGRAAGDPPTAPVTLIEVPARPDDQPPARVAAGVGRVAATLLESGGFATLVVTGGDIAGAVFAALGLNLVRVAGQFTAGIPLLTVAIGGRSRTVITKAGGFGADSLFADLAAGAVR